jgi:hypothetical protein
MCILETSEGKEMTEYKVTTRCAGCAAEYQVLEVMVDGVRTAIHTGKAGYISRLVIAMQRVEKSLVKGFK